MNAIDHLRRASKLIAAAERANRSLLSEAAGHFWSATFDEEHWPLTLRVASTSLKAKLLTGGTIAQTIDSLDPEHLAQLANELERFCLEVIEDPDSQPWPEASSDAELKTVTFDAGVYSTS